MNTKQSLIITVVAIGITVALLACTSSVRLKEDYYAEKQLKEQVTEVRDSAGEFVENGKFVSWYPNGAEQTTGEYNHGRKTGLWITKFEDGRLMEWQDYVDGERHGLSVSYYSNRNKKHEGKYAHDLKYGWWRYWYENSLLREETLYKDGRKDGPSTTWYATGQKEEEAVYRGGVLDGPYTAWRESGLRSIEGQYTNGRADGLWTVWDDMGLVIASEIYAAGRLVTDSINALVAAPATDEP